jgi:hypothetical protein
MTPTNFLHKSQRSFHAVRELLQERVPVGRTVFGKPVNER